MDRSCSLRITGSQVILWFFCLVCIEQAEEVHFCSEDQIFIELRKYINYKRALYLLAVTHL